MGIRAERSGDEAAIARVHTAAFGQPQEAKLVDELRGTADPYLSLVALQDGALVGHILFTPVTVRGPEQAFGALGLGPMGVVPQYQRRGIGSALVRAGLEACNRLRHEIVFVLGHPTFYPRFGFRLAAPLGLRYGSEAFDSFFMVAALTPGVLKGRSGWVEYLPPFAEV